MKPTKKYGKKIDLALSTWLKLYRAFNSFNKKSNESIKTFGLTQPQFAVIEALGHLGKLKVGELCDKLMVTGGSMTLVLDNVTKLGYVERIFDNQDRRAIYVQLTPKGKILFDKIFKNHAENILKYMSVLNQEEQILLGELLKKLGKSINKI
ncbi:MAG: MarR family transcriptional regulator [Melioribacteraceae bacterium]|nr:MarR family transcriptional regulator [Melioribacteraceae bacterium]